VLQAPGRWKPWEEERGERRREEEEEETCLIPLLCTRLLS